MVRFVAYVNTVLDRAERMPWLPVIAGLSFGSGIRWVLLQPHPWGWVLLGCGLLFGAIRPLGTTLRNRHRLREAKRLLAEAREGNLLSMLGAMGKLNQVERSPGMKRRDDA